MLAIALAHALLLPLSAAPASPGRPATPAEARAFVGRINAELEPLAYRENTAQWIAGTFITGDTERQAAWATEAQMAATTRAILEAERFRGLRLDPETARALQLLRTGGKLPAPVDPARRAELASVGSRLEGSYGKGKYCGPGGTGTCRDLGQLEETMSRSASWEELLDTWQGWHAVGAPLRSDYRRLVELGNEGARQIGFRDMGELWRSGFDMSPAAFEADVDRLWAEMLPLYRELHCHVRARLQERYGKERVPDGKPIPAHVLGNMWAQQWDALYPFLEPYPGVAPLDVDGALRAQGWTPERMVRTGESFFTSLGLPALPATFWERSMLVKPRDREVVCHASAWDLDARDDLRIKMCIRPTEEDLRVVHHELGHNYYQRAYQAQPHLFRTGANEGFHEAIGDALVLSMTPGYYARLGLAREAPADERALVNFQMRVALDRVAFLPFGKLIDQWRWDVFSGKVPPERWNAAWWELRRKVQGVEAPVARSEADFDPGAKYHVPAHTPYTRYFLASVYMFQFHRALCRAAGQTGPLHQCSIAGSREAGARLAAMLALGASRPWADALQALTGERRADPSALLEYFAPLRTWLAEQNRGRTCGW
ncbi:MAG: M2 family metallopeptidase [Deltaproteobacteria bacterium]|nr:M2 family metallopeptidase [Deltaproteobacteria bacterium]